ncbi:hypothetical protein AYL99_11938 [Fonsecaea erecta]|uniref:Uncharacterized protein n=1 Tax=Fonsecaea erecta TaxID=1367422 RepID=A0A178Z3B1_9EURO|nr:hypothetical protein AYL99_11938 [Fonsecaea erecta]OAP53916.1 hypothetical protein AYL99_11938 [Fonsecaea erecta]
MAVENKPPVAQTIAADECRHDFAIELGEIERQEGADDQKGPVGDDESQLFSTTVRTLRRLLHPPGLEMVLGIAHWEPGKALSPPTRYRYCSQAGIVLLANAEN